MNAHHRDGPSGPRLRFRPKFDKIVELLVYLAHKRPNADQYQAVKFFYLADRLHLNRYGRPITFETYFALDYGPVASNALDLIKGRPDALASAQIEALPIRIDRRDKIHILAEPLREVDYDVFSTSDIRVFDEIIADFGDKSFDELYRITHDHFAYDIAWRTRRDGKRAPMYYEDMLDEGVRKASLVGSLESVAEHMK